jgi:RNA polymerase sigma factor for flagellar operon FliA
MSQTSFATMEWATECSRDLAPASPKDLGAEVAAYLPLVRRIAQHLHRRCPPSVQLDDLVAAGSVGLFDALRRSGPDRGQAFEAYACLRIRGAIIDELRALDWLSRGERRAMRRNEGAFTTVVGFDDLPASFDAEAHDAAGALETAELRDQLAEAISHLPEREAGILAMHYCRGRAFKEIASELNVTAGRVSQLHTRAVQMLQRLMNEPKRRCA